jgi:hypothetical protein
MLTNANKIARWLSFYSSFHKTSLVLNDAKQMFYLDSNAGLQVLSSDGHFVEYVDIA